MLNSCLRNYFRTISNVCWSVLFPSNASLHTSFKVVQGHVLL